MCVPPLYETMDRATYASPSNAVNTVDSTGAKLRSIGNSVKLRVHSDELCFPYAAEADMCVQKIGKFSISVETQLPQPHL